MINIIHTTEQYINPINKKRIIANNEYSEDLDKANIPNDFLVKAGKIVADSITVSGDNHLEYLSKNNFVVSIYFVPVTAQVDTSIIMSKTK